MGDGTLMRTVRTVVDSKRILDALLRSLTSKKTPTLEDVDTVLGITIRKIADTLFAQAITVFTVDKATDRVRFQNVYYSPSLYGGDETRRAAFDKKAREMEQMSLHYGQGIVGEVIRSGKTAFVPDAQADKRFYVQVDRDTGFVTRSLIAVPLQVDKEVVGCIEVLNKCMNGKTVTQFAPDDVFLLEDVAAYSARIIKRVKDPHTPFSDREMASYVARLAKLPFMELDPKQDINRELLDAVGGDILKRYQLLPLKRLPDDAIRAALSNPIDFQAIGDFEIVAGLKVSEKVVAAASDIAEVLKAAFPEASRAEAAAEAIHAEYAQEAAPQEEQSYDGEDENSGPIVKLSNRIIEDAYTKGASDIHIEPMENALRVRYRIDGILKEQMTVPIQAQRALVSRLKIMCDLDIAERRMPQDGRIVFKKFSPKFDLDLRVSTAPMNFGEKICARILDKTKSTLPLDKLGFSAYNMALYRDLIQVPNGMILHTGPTGSGKSMTLYAALNEVNTPEWNISTAEDPIEYTLPGLNQMQMKKDIGLTFANALRCFLRQDPDMILVGEIRDKETAEIAIEAALTGHVLFSTLHTNDAPTTISRFDEMGIEPFMVSTCLVCICAQRLPRRLCKCKAADTPTPAERELLERALDDAPVAQILRPKGCDKCTQSGYKGRIGTHELLKNNDELRAMINKRATALQLKKAAREAGMRTLFEDLMEKVKQGLVSLPEAIATARPDDEPSPLRKNAPARGAASDAPTALGEMLGLDEKK